MQETDIAWTDTTWNPVHGCSRVSAGCDNCYAERISRKFGHTEKPWTPENAGDNVMMRRGKLDEPREMQKGARVFVNSMSDLFHGEVNEAFIRDVFEVMRDTPRHIYQILTKRPGRAAHMDLDWPDNVWMGTSVEDHRVTERIEILRHCDASTLFISFEPLIGPIGEVDLSGYDWVIVGGESGEEHRPMKTEWVEEIYNQAKDEDVAWFFKQSAANTNEVVADRHQRFTEQNEVPEMPKVTQNARGSRGLDAYL